MKTKVAKEIIDMGFGFPVRLSHVTMVEIRGEWAPKLDYNKLAEQVLLVLSRLARPLTGHEVRFVRQHFNLTTTRFGALFGLSHVAVLNWEKKGDNATDMQWSAEKDLRLFIQAKLSNDPAEVGRLYSLLAPKPVIENHGKHPALGPIEAGHLAAA
jgi:DNA-binding transcriptional regulator YiaG